ncbi:MAG: hypothetical protein M0Z75_13600 [Nitrospiraceae bacterium]|nr:hypothetical protein [Nitrospiraceae bacterium]
MELKATIALVLGLFLFTFILNLPFGFLRAKVRKFSVRWFLYIHLPIPLIFLGRRLSHLDYRYIPIFVAAALIGQISGGKLVF